MSSGCGTTEGCRESARHPDLVDEPQAACLSVDARVVRADRRRMGDAAGTDQRGHRRRLRFCDVAQRGAVVTNQEVAAFARRIASDMLRRGAIPAAVSVDDAAQAGLVSALEARARYDENLGASVRTFLGIRIRGAIRDEIHRQMRSCVETSYEDMGDAAPGHTETPERHAMHYERLTRLVTAINRLPVRWQQLLALRYRDDWTQREIAQDWGITESRVSQMHSEAVDRLRAQA